jgi:hypothetical protein
MWLRWFPWKFIIRRLARAHGFVDPITILSHLGRLAQPSEVVVPIEILRAGVVFHARGLINSRVIQQNLDWVWPYWICRQFDPRTEAFIPRAYSLTHVNLTARNWTAVGVPGCDAFPIVDPRGLLTPFWDGWSLDAWVVAEDGRALFPSRQAEAGQRLDIAGGLAVITSCGTGGLELESRVEAVTLPEVVCRLTVRAQADARAWLVVSARPYNPEGVSFIRRIELNDTRDRWLIDRRRAVRFSRAVQGHAVSDYLRGDVKDRLFRGAEEQAVACDAGLATAAALFELRPGETREVIAEVPLEKDGKTPRRAEAAGPAASRWDRELRRACRLRIPDTRWQFLYDAALRTLILHCPDDVYPGPFTYKRFWFRDAAFILHAMLCAGLSARAAGALERFFPRQTARGYFRSQEGEWDANGEVLWLLQRFCELTAGAPGRDWAGPVGRAACWIMRKRLQGDTETPCAGLMPAGFSAEHLGPNDHYYWDDFWSIAGLRSAGRMLSALGKEKDAARCDGEAEDMLAALERSLDHVRTRLRTPAMPASCHRRLDSGAIGSLAAGYPLQLFGPNDRRLLSTVDYLMDRCLVAGGFFQDMIHSGINVYLTLHIAQVLLRASDPRFAALVRTAADLASPTGQWPEAIHPHTRGGCMGDGQHAWAAAEWVMMMRNSFLYEETHTQRLVVGAGVLPTWLAAGRALSIGPAPTSWGVVRLSLEPAAKTVCVRWEADWQQRQPPIEVRLPGVEPVLLAEGQTSVAVPRPP